MMIYGIGTDIVEVRRFYRWVSDPLILKRFFSDTEIIEGSVQRLSEHYAAHFAAKEAFSKALGTGIKGFSLKNVEIIPDACGKPQIQLSGDAAAAARIRCENFVTHVSLSHEKDYAIAFVVIETCNT